jgi:hypothetical protein
MTLVVYADDVGAGGVRASTAASHAGVRHGS